MRHRSFLRSMLGAALSVGLLGVAAPAGAVEQPAPRWEREATATSLGADLAQLRPGTVLSRVRMHLGPELAAVGTGLRIRYVSTAPDGRHIVVSGAVLTPRVRKELPGQRDTIAWGHGTDGIADHCAPSLYGNLDTEAEYRVYAQTAASYLKKGWTVAATDYQGLGTPGPHPYLIGKSEARGMIDSVRAARRLDRSLSRDWVASGHSQGGQAALFAGEVGSYAKGLRLRGVVGMSAASELDVLAPLTIGTPGNGYLVIALYGLAAVDPSVHPTELLAAPARRRLDVLRTGCYSAFMTAFEKLTPTELVVGGALPADILRKLGAAGNAAQVAGRAPVLLVHGTADLEVPVFVADELAKAYRAKGTKVVLKKYAGVDHNTLPLVSAGDVLRWIADRFTDRPAPPSC